MMEITKMQDIEFYMTVCACSSLNVVHRSKHNSLVAQNLAKLLTDAAKEFSMDSHLTVTSCCCGNSHNHNHSKHYIIFRVPRSVLECTITSINHDFTQNSVLMGESGPNALIDTLTPGQQTWLGVLSIRLISFSYSQKTALRTIKSCTYFDSIDLCKPNLNFPTESTLSNKTAETDCNSALYCLKAEELTKELTPLHNFEQRKLVWHHFLSGVIPYPKVEWLRWYFGDSVGYYFYWLRHYCTALLVPAVMGMLCWILASLANIFSSVEGENGNTAAESSKPPLSIFTILYGITIILWAIGCTKLWRRQKSQLTEDWSPHELTNVTNLSWIHNPHDRRPQFQGVPRISPVTGQLELYFGHSQRRRRYIFSGLVTLVCLFIAIALNVLLMNLEGFIKQDRSPYLYFSFAGCWSEPGEIFDPAIGYMNLVPSILHPILIFLMNQIIFRHIAEWLTEQENHETRTKWQHALIIKRFLFETVDAYACLAYLGFVLADWSALQSMLLTIFATDSIRRVIIECFLPWISHRFRKYKDSLRAAKHKKMDNDEQPQERACITEARYGVPYEEFDDYLEMVLEHGYIVIFAFACPPYIALMAVICAWVEAYFDSFKLLEITRRPLPDVLEDGPAIWLLLLSIQAWFGLFSNVALLVFRTDWNLSTYFLLEHVLIGFGLFIELGISNTPIKALNSMRARAYNRYAKFFKMIKKN